MSCPGQGVLGHTLTFTVRSFNASGGSFDADSPPTFSIYEDSVDTPVVTGTMSKLDDADTVGLYSKTITLNGENGFTVFKTYTIDITAVVSSVAASKTYSFLCIGQETVSGGTDTDTDTDTGSSVRAVPDYKGTFVQGMVSSFFLRITNFDGNPIDPEQISFTVTDPSVNPALSGIPEKIAKGYFVFDWSVPSDQTVGKHLITWTYTIDDVTNYELQSVVISASGASTAFYSTRIAIFRSALTYFLREAQNIPVYQEQSKPSRDQKKYEFTFPRWNQTPGVRIYRNQEIMSSGYEVDFFKGKVVFDGTSLEQDTITADYNFRWFDDDDLDQFLVTAVSDFDCYPPVNAYTIYNIPDIYAAPIIYKACVNALMQMIFSLQWQEPQQVFGGAEAAQKAVANLQSLKENYEKQYSNLTEAKRKGPYPRTQLISTPEYSLPGGRSRWFRYLFSGSL